MLEVSVNFLCSLIMSLAGFMIIKNIIKSNVKLYNYKNLILLLILTVIAVMLHRINYTNVYTITIFALNIIVYKEIFNISIQDSTIATGILMFVIFISEIIVSIMNIFDIDQIRATWYLMIITNCLSVAISLIISKLLNKKLQSFYKSITTKSSLSDNIFFVLLVISLSSLMYNITNATPFGLKIIMNTSIVIGIIILSYLFMKSKDNYNKLTSKYDSLFNYVQNFEDWIEKEQLNRHEYKNQLAVLRCLTKEKKVKDKIDEILDDSINVEGEVVNQLKSLPKGGLKGLMYYKAAIAQKNKINLTVNVSIENKSILNKLSEQNIRSLCKLIGIYFDNAIEAAKETRKKVVMIEIYELTDKVSIVFSNTFKQHKNFKDRNKKGVSSKGKGHGNGLYFASKIVAQNEWLEEKQEIIDKYYIQQLIIKKNIPQKLK